MVTKIGELARRVGFKGTPSHRIAEPSAIKTLPPIDNAVPGRSTIRTSIDCYVSGQYVQRGGKVVEVTQRYQVFVAYGKETQLATMQQLRDRIMQDFHDRFEKGFNIGTVFVPDLPVPKAPDFQEKKPGEPIEMYAGSHMFRQMTRFEKSRYEVGTQREQSRLNISGIKERYGVR